jgi:hypothetical protein
VRELPLRANSRSPLQNHLRLSSRDATARDLALQSLLLSYSLALLNKEPGRVASERRPLDLALVVVFGERRTVDGGPVLIALALPSAQRVFALKRTAALSTDAGRLFRSC